MMVLDVVAGSLAPWTPNPGGEGGLGWPIARWAWGGEGLQCEVEEPGTNVYLTCPEKAGND